MLTLAIQAGGESLRMGRDKALLPFLGKPLILRVIERLAPLADEIIIMANRPEPYRFLGFPIFPDVKSGHGALGGLYTAMASAGNPLVAVVACDMPFASLPLFSYARDLLIKENVDVVIPSTGDGVEPLHAVYRCETCLPAVEVALDSYRLRLTSWLPLVKIITLKTTQIAKLDPKGLAFWNINTPEDFHQAEQRARLLDP
jgi:molybdopterin-guanine dinucleotide biosynthesis protein A